MSIVALSLVFGTALAAAAELPLLTTLGNTPLGTGQVGVGAYVTTYGSEVSDCHFEYGLTASYGQSAPCDVTPPADNEPHLVRAHLTGLALGATYHVRLIVISTAGTQVGEDTTFPVPTGPVAESCPNSGALGVGFLPNCRAWEMVTPPGKNGANVIADTNRTRASVNGNALGFEALGAFGDSEGTDVSNDYIAERSPQNPPSGNGWVTHGITPNQLPPSGEGIFVQYHATYLGEFSPDLSRGVLGDFTPQTNDPFVSKVPNLYLRTNLLSAGPGSYQLLTACAVCAETGPLPAPPAIITSVTLQPHLAWAVPDLSRVIIESRQRLTVDTPMGSPPCDPTTVLGLRLFCHTHLYESDGQTIKLVGRIPASPATACNDESANRCVSADVSQAGQGTEMQGNATPNLVPDTMTESEDGHVRIFFTQPTDSADHTLEEGANPRAINKSGEGHLYMRVDGVSTVEIDASERSTPAASAPSRFLDATPDGSHSFFVSAAALTNEAPDDGQPKLYAYDVAPGAEGHHLKFIAGQVQGMIGVSTDGKYVYFVASGIKLVPGQPFVSEAIYLWHDEKLAFVSPVFDPGLPGDAQFMYSAPEARVTPDGRHLLFVSDEGQGILSSFGGTDYNQSSRGCDNGRCRELYLYSADTNTLDCASCDPTGGPPTAEAHVFLLEHQGAAASAWHRNHALSENGRYVFFSTAEHLVAGDTNGVSNAYVYDSVTDQVRLLSSGEDAQGSYFLDASSDGGNAFFATAEQLSGWDYDSSYDVYDARIGGGLPEPRPNPPSCQGDACQPAPTNLTDPNIASFAFSGPGTPVAVHSVTKRGRKVKKKHARKRQVPKHRARRAGGNRRAGK
jgi:hypothetical protein